MENEKGKEKQKVVTCVTHPHNTNWNHTKVMALINCKKRKHIVLKYIIDPHANMVFARNKWNKIAKDLQETTKSRSPCNGRMCKNEQTCVKDNYKRISNYHKGIGHNTSYLDLTIKEKKTSSSKTFPWRILPCYCNFPRGKEHPYSNACENIASRWCLCTTKSRRG